MPLARAVYFETSILWGAARRTDDPSLQNLTGLTRNLGIPLFTTSLVVDELAEGMKRELLDVKAQLEAALDAFVRRRVAPPTVSWDTPFDRTIAELPTVVRANVGSYGLVVLPNRTIDQERLLRMAVRKEPPFEEKREKGFRDTVILLTILGHATDEHRGSILIASNDGAIIGSLSSLPEVRGLEVETARDMGSCVKHFEDFLDEATQRFIAARKEACREAVLAEKGRVEEFIRQKGIFSEGHFSDHLPLGESLVSIEDVAVGDIQIIALGILQGSPEGRVQVTLDVQLDARVKVRQAAWPQERRFKVGEGETSLTVGALNRRLRKLRGEDIDDTTSRSVAPIVRLDGSIHDRWVLPVPERPRREAFSDVRIEALNPPIEPLFASLLRPR